MEESSRPSIVALASSVLADLRRLMSQEVQLAKHEMQQEVRKLVTAAIQGGLAAVLGLMAVILLCLTFVYVLHSLVGLPLWASYGVVAILAAGGAAGLGYLVMKLATSVRPWPFRTLRTVQEDAQWIKEQVLSPKT
jgi:uncharacterized membrane protein YqjE